MKMTLMIIHKAPAKETYVKVLTLVDSPAALDSYPPPLDDCDDDVYGDYEHGLAYGHVGVHHREGPSYLQEHLLYNEDQC